MIETDEQRRWWFATHPEYSWSRKDTRQRRDSPGTGQLSRHPAADPNAYDKYEDVLDGIEALALELHELIRKGDEMGLEADPHTALDLIPVGRFISAPVQSFKGLLRSLARGAIVSAVKRGSSGGPGTWKEVGRSPLGLEHQSRMSGQPIRFKDGKFRIKEYEVPVEGRRDHVLFDDYRDGVYYEYKAKQGNLINKDGVFPDWCKERYRARQEAEWQIKAAQGSPVIWKVGADQVKAYKAAIGRLPGLIIVP